MQAIFNHLTEIEVGVNFREIGHLLKQMTRYKNPLYSNRTAAL